ncbi:NifB/NifX family molybdenum-iron cluster-binding protein [Thiocystis violacea]|uniref:NifB/NifX family molybdenum-iron cluster-binding protein n=1 Tax=Thiocystis violacea TaxID=13725 RepID=UPI001F5B3D5E|nr:NifB/NifX family molybdenum-iron cluster-binding protein [Thiocystis violacea]MBK1723906.1 dinitrogenase iron-molybdenum cofactor biosynthesis protein [Thiocystis violacea]
MKLAISIAGQSLDSPFDARFGRAESFCLVDTDTGAWTTHANPAQSASGGAGVQAAQFVAKLGAQAVVSGAYGPKAYDTLSAANIQRLLAPGKDACSAADILASFTAGQLIPADGASHGGHHGG